jgi:dTDP-4-dehydrorhamnose reductase
MKHFLRLRFTTFGPSFNPSRPLLIEMIADSTPKVTRPNQFFSPISTVSLNRVIDDLLRGDKLPRVYHLASQRISKTDCFHRLAKSIGVTLSPFPLTDVSELDLSLESRTHNFLISEEIALTTAARSKCHHA